jgi:2Fe-2S ferredoxin
MLIEITVNSKKIKVNLSEEKTLLDVILENNIIIKANCEGNGVCGKCHVVIDEEHYDKLEISNFELDTLEKQLNVTPLSRLACQIKIDEKLDGADVSIIDNDV